VPRAGGTETSAPDRRAYRGEAAIRAGATATLDPAEPVRDLLERTGGRGVDVAFEAASSSATPQQAIEMARIGGRMVLVGIQPDDNVVLHTSLLRRKAITISPVRRAAHVYPRALALVRRGLVQLDWLVTHRFPLEQTNAAFAMAADYAGGALRVARA